MNMKNVEVLE